MHLLLSLLIFWSCNDAQPLPSNTSGKEQNTALLTNKFLALGDSYTIGQSVEVKYRWPNIFQDSLAMLGIDIEEPTIIARSGWRTDALLSAALTEVTESDYGLVSLLIGVNNQYQGRSVEDYRPEFEELLRFAIARVGGDKSRVFVLSIPDYGCTPFGSSRADEIAIEIDAFNNANKEITENLGVAYFDITPASRLAKQNPELVASDGLHPSGEQYILWVREVLKNSEFIGSLTD